MSIKKELNNKQRITNLTLLLRDSKQLGFNPNLVSRYHNQLVGLLVEIAREKYKDEVLRGSA